MAKNNEHWAPLFKQQFLDNQKSWGWASSLLKGYSSLGPPQPQMDGEKTLFAVNGILSKKKHCFWTILFIRFYGKTFLKPCYKFSLFLQAFNSCFGGLALMTIWYQKAHWGLTRNSLGNSLLKRSLNNPNLNIWAFEHLNNWTFEHLNIWTSEHLNIWTFEHLNIKIFEYLII